MAQFTKEQIVERATELAKMIAETQEVDFFKRAEAQINQNKKVQEIIDSIKSLQKQAVNFQHFGKSEALKQVEEKIDNLQAELDSIPVVEEFKNSQIEVNDLLQLVAHTISNNVTNQIITSTGGDLLAGETGSKVNNNKGCGCH
ncbi:MULTISPECIES: RicAFT regulatory complex protein RicA family protein [unclassified Fredinandcohnia]|uniref:RicAFT regulatory complex protein RicA family protein n=1 Tax=unclassified Fredinandcohnia TaxID=2837514 RepID=UPI0030FD36AF